MSRPHTPIGLVVMSLVALYGCGDAGTGVANPPDTTTSAASAVAAIFSTSDSSSKVVWQGKAEDNQHCESVDPGCTCDEVLSGSQDMERPIENAAFGDPGLYGSVSSGLRLEEQHFCALPSAPTTLNTTSSGPDGKGLLAKFTLTGDISATCTDPATGATTTFAMKTGSTGAWRNTNATGTDVAHEPEAYGHMVFGTATTSVTLDCTMFLDSDEKIISADCSDENGNAITIDTSITCQVD